jgi:hypothetical protein
MAQCDVSADRGAQPRNAPICRLVGWMRFASLPPAGVFGLDLGDHL